jgi:hypothetical protein
MAVYGGIHNAAEANFTDLKRPPRKQPEPHPMKRCGPQRQN